MFIHHLLHPGMIPPAATPRPFLHDPSPPATLQLGPHDGTKNSCCQKSPWFFLGGGKSTWMTCFLGGTKKHRFRGGRWFKNFTLFVVRPVPSSFLLGRCFFACSTAGIVVFLKFLVLESPRFFPVCFCLTQNDGVEKVVLFNYGEAWCLAAFGSVH